MSIRPRPVLFASFVLVFAAMLLVAVTAFGEASSGYATWTSGPPNDTDPLTPHIGYTTTTAKCAVCHAVHKAAPTGQLLLNDTVDGSCSYCHIETSVGVVQIYNGNENAYLVDSKYNHSAGGGAPCNGCHSVHGSDAYTGPIIRKILKRLPIQPSLVGFFTGSTSTPDPIYTGTFPFTLPSDPDIILPAVSGLENEEWRVAKNVQSTAFCTSCHPYFTHASEDLITTDRMVVGNAISTETTTFASHPLKRQWDYTGPGTYEWNFQAAGSTLPDYTQVAWTSTDGCHTCHGDGAYIDSGGGLQESSYPHYTPYRQRFLISQYPDGGWGMDTADSQEDGTCLLCHRRLDWGAPGDNVGVGYTY
jgi:hypothetical protein